MAYINAATSGNFATVMVRVNDGGAPAIGDFITNVATPVKTAATLEIPALQDITITNNAGTFRWKQLDSLSEKVVSTVSTNSVGGNLVIDTTAFFGDGGVTTSADDKGLFNLSNEKTSVDFVVFFSGYSVADRFIMGTGYITNVAPKVSADSPVWVSPFTIEVDGDYSVGVVPAAA